MYGYQNSAELENSSENNQSGFNFGLNTGATITKFEFNANGGVDNTPQECIEITVKVGEREFRNKFFPITRAWTKDRQEITDTTSEEYIQGITLQTVAQNAVLTQYAQCFVNDATLQQAFKTPVSSFKDYAQILTRLVQSVPNWNTQPVDVFLQYQFEVKGDNKTTYLEVPKSVKHGVFICKSLGEGFTEVKTDKSLNYIKRDIVHPFKRGAWFITSNFANVVKIQEKIENPMSATSTPQAGGWEV